MNTTRSTVAGAFFLALYPVLTLPLSAQALSGVFEEHFTIAGLGSSVAGAGDVNGDGFDDVIVGDPTALPAMGTVFVYSGRDGTELWHRNVESNLFSPLSLAGAGDVNQDGFDDVIVGTPAAIHSGTIRGAATVYSGRDGTMIWQIHGAMHGDSLGSSVAGAGDVNKDGFADVIVSDISARSVYVRSGPTGALLWQFNGTGAAGAGDVNGDGFADVIVGASRADPNGKMDAGSVHVYSGKDGSVFWQVDGEAVDDNLGSSFAGAGDVNGDGFADVIVGAFGVDPHGSVFVYSGVDGTTLWRIDGLPDVTVGTGVAGAGDVNGDGLDDVILSGGFGLITKFTFVGSVMDGKSLWRFDNVRVAAGAGDVNGDGFADVIVGAGSSAEVHVYNPVVLAYGTGLTGSGNVTPTIGTGGELPSVGSSTFKVEVTEALGGALCAIAGSFVRTETPLLGGTLYGDFLTPGASLSWGFTATGTPGTPGAGTASLPIPIPSDVSLIGFTTYWQGFVMDSGSPLPIGFTHTGGLAVTVLQ